MDEFFPKMKFKPFIADAKTKGDNLEFTTPSVEATIFENDDGDWEKHKVYDTESEANTALEGFFVQSEVTGEWWFFFVIINYLETETEKFPLVFTLNVMESIQEKYGTIEAWSNLIQRDGEPDIKALKFFITEAINEGLEIEAERTGEKPKAITSKKAGRILTEIGLSGAANKIMATISDSVEMDEVEKNTNRPQNL